MHSGPFQITRYLHQNHFLTLFLPDFCTGQMFFLLELLRFVSRIELYFRSLLFQSSDKIVLNVFTCFLNTLDFDSEPLSENDKGRISFPDLLLVFANLIRLHWQRLRQKILSCFCHQPH